MKRRVEGTPNRGSVALKALCPTDEYGAQSRLAKEIDADEAQFSRWIRGVVRPDTTSRLKIQERWGIPALDWDEPPDDAPPASERTPKPGKEPAA